MNLSIVKTKAFLPISIILLAAFCIRIAIALIFSPPLLQDEKEYFAIAHSLTHNGIFGTDGTPTAYRPPGYPFILSLIFALSGDSIIAVRVLQALADTISCAFIFFICRRFASNRSATITAACYAVFPGSALYVSLIMTETLFTSLFLLFIMLYTKDGFPGSVVGKIVIGSIVGALTLIRPNAVILIAVMFAWEVIRSRSLAPIRQYILVLFTFFIVLSPWLIRNKIQFDSFSLTSNGGVNFWIGHNKDATGSFRYVTETSPLENISNEFTRSKAGYREGLSFLIHHPLTEVKLLLMKGIRMFEPDFALMQSLFYKPEWKAYQRALLIYKEFPQIIAISLHLFTAIIILAGLWSLFFANDSSDQYMLLIKLLICGWIGVHLVFFSVARFRLPIVPLFISMAVYSVEAWKAKTYTVTPIPKYSFIAITILLAASWIAIFVMIYN